MHTKGDEKDQFRQKHQSMRREGKDTNHGGEEKWNKESHSKIIDVEKENERKPRPYVNRVD